MLTKAAWILAVSTVIVTSDAEPSCKFKGELKQDLVCTPGDEDYALERGLVSDSNITTRITLRACRIISVDFESFERLFALKYLDLSMNKISILQLGVLDEAVEVTHLNLSYNLLKGFPLGLFDQKPNLEVLDLKGNIIDSLELGIFDPLKKLRHLDLSNNRLVGPNINAYLFDQSKIIKFLDFSQNNMNGALEILLHSFQELNFLNLDMCSLTEVPKFATITNMETLRKLLLTRNRIRKLQDPNAFNNLVQLEILNIGWNVIDTVHENIFKSLKMLKTIILRNNKLKELPDTLFKNMDNLINIDLAGNQIEFVPVNAFRGTKVKNLNLANNRFSYLTDNFLLELRNSGATLTKFFFNQNPWQCACLKQILYEVKFYGVEYNSAKYNGKDIVCVTTKEFYCKRHKEFNDLYVGMYDDLVN